MAEGQHKYHIVGADGGGGGGVAADLQSLCGVGKARRVKIFAYAVLFAFVGVTAFLAFNPDASVSTPWFARFFSASSTSNVRSQFSNLVSSFFPPPHFSGASPPTGGIGSGARNISAAGAVEEHNNGTAPAGTATPAKVKNGTTVDDSDQAPKDQKKTLDKLSGLDNRNPSTKQANSPTSSKTASSPDKVNAKNATMKIENSDRKTPSSAYNQTILQNQKNQTKSLDKQSSAVTGDNGNQSKAVDLKSENVSYVGNSTAKKAASNSGREFSIESMRKCDLFDGKWVKDDAYPLYKEGSCPHIDESFDCAVNGRPDQDYQKLRWQPNGCNIPRLNGTDMLERLRGRRLVFVGDSLNRNMWESLVCTLRNSVKDKTRVFEASGRREFRTEGSYSFVFQDYNCSVEFFRSPFLVQEWESPEPNGTSKETLRLDLIEKKFDKYKKADMVVFNTGHWWTHEKTSLGKDYYQEGSHVYGQLNVVDAFHKALSTWAKWVDSNIDSHKTLVFFRGYSSSHFSGGRWNSGGSCDQETQPITNEAYLAKYPPKMKVLETVLKEMKTSVSYLNITRMTDYRKDAHPSVYRKRNLTVEERTSSLRYQDCSHWCLPGVPDSWNELLYAEMLIKLH